MPLKPPSVGSPAAGPPMGRPARAARLRTVSYNESGVSTLYARSTGRARKQKHLPTDFSHFSPDFLVESRSSLVVV